MRRPLSDKRPIGPFAQLGGEEAEARKSPLVLAREFKQEVLEGNEDGRVSELEVGSISWKSLLDTSDYRLELGLHETAVNNTFKFRPEGPREPKPIGVANPQATDASSLGGKGGELAAIFREAFDVRWDFAELEAASIGGEHLTDYEFTYEGFTAEQKIINSNIDEAVQKI